MKVRLIKPALMHPAGDVIDPDPVVASMLVERGVAVYVGKPPPPVLETATHEPRAERAVKVQAHKR